MIPLLVGGARMPSADELPESVRPLSRRNALELSDLRYEANLISVGNERREAGRFGFLMRSIGSELLITRICLRCPELRGSGRLPGG